MPHITADKLARPKPTKCPICGGTRKVKRPSFKHGNPDIEKSCHVCHETGLLQPHIDEWIAYANELEAALREPSELEKRILASEIVKGKVAEEKERCAKIAENFHDSPASITFDYATGNETEAIAAAIRGGK